MGSVHAEPLLDASQIAANAAAIAAHVGDASIHFTEASISHLNISNIGSNSHAAIDTHISDATIHYADAPNDGMSYVRNSLGWQLETVQAFGEYVGPFDASIGTFPVTTNQGDWFNCTVAGTVDGQAFIVGDILVALIDAPSTTTFAGNWSLVPNISVSDHTLLTNIGVNTHAQIDTHIADTSIHFADAPADAQDYVRNNNAWAVASPGGVTDHGALTGLADDDHANYAYLPGRAGGQTLIGGTLAGQLLTLQGSANANRGRNVLAGGATIDWDFASDAVTSGGLLFQNTVPASGGLISSSITIANTIGVNNGLFIMSALDDNSSLTWSVSPGFAVTTLFFARQNYRSSTGGVAPAQALIFAAQSQFWLTGAGDVTTSNYVALSHAPIIRVDNSGDDMRITNTTAVRLNPLFNTRNANSTADFGTLRGVHMQNAATVLFGQALGAEIATAWIGLDCEALTGLTVSGRKAAVRSAITASANNRFLENVGGANSDHGTGHMYFNDDRGIALGQVGIAYDAWLRWVGASNYLGINFFATGDDLALSSPAANRFLIASNATTDNEIAFDFRRMAFGQAGAVGNQVGVFVAGTRSVSVGGGWADFLLTQAGNITLNAAMSQVFGWTINAPSITLGTGSVTDAGGLLLGGNVNQGTNRYGMLILSNPSGGTINEALRVQNGRTRVADLFHEGTNLGFYGTAPIAKQLAVGVNAAAIHAALVALGLIT